MLLCLDVGNSHIYGGIIANNAIVLRFRQTSKISTSDELGIFLKMVLRENNFSSELITKIAICSVVPQLDYSLRAACLKYFSKEPFIVSEQINTGLGFHYRQASEIGADRIANAIAAVETFPNTNLIIIDFGTATTFCVITAEKDYCGGAILPGIRLSVDALANNTAKLPTVEILKPENTVGKSTIEGIQSGIYFGAIGACREIIANIKQEKFLNQHCTVLATGGFAPLFEHCAIYDHLMLDLVLLGINIAVQKNG